MKPEVHRKPTEDEMKKHNKEHPIILAKICAAHKQVRDFVRKKYGDDPKIMHIDRGN